MPRYLENEKGGVRGKLANAASFIYWIAIRKRRQENSKKKAGTIPKMGIARQAPEGRLTIAQDEVLGKPPKTRTESRSDGTSVDGLHLQEAALANAQSTSSRPRDRDPK
jgi:hypothetical protein